MEVRHFEEGYYTHPEIVALMQKVQVQVGNEPEHQQAGPGMPTAVVEVDLHSGATLRMKQGFNAARAAYLRTDQGQDEKLRPMAEAVLPKAQIDALFQSLRTLDQQRDIRDVLALTIAPRARDRARLEGRGSSAHAGDHSRAASAAGPVKRCMHPRRPRAQGDVTMAAAGRCDRGHAATLTRRTCRIAPTTSRCDTACLAPGQIRLGGPSQARPPVGLQCFLHTGGPPVGRDNASQAALELGHDVARHQFVAPVQLVTRAQSSARKRSPPNPPLASWRRAIPATQSSGVPTIH